MTDQPTSPHDEPQQPAQKPLVRPGGFTPERSRGSAADFDSQYRAHNKEVFREIVSRDLLDGHEPGERAREYAERGKPEFVLAYLLVCDLSDPEKRELYAHAYDQRAQLTQRRADEFDRRFHRPFPLIRLEASKDRMTAQRIRAGGNLRPGLGRPLPTL